MSTHAHIGQDSAMEVLASQAAAHDHDPHPHPPFLAHHFDTPAQQYMTGKIGMWIFLATEILMFGGLFCAYSVYRYNYPEVFLYAANEYLSTAWGALNTVILLASSLTMAMAVRYAQLDRHKALTTCLFLTLLGGVGFMCIKAVEYRDKYDHHVGLGSTVNAYSKNYKGDGGKLSEGQTTSTSAVAPQAAGGAAGTADPQAPAAPSEATAASASPLVGIIHPNPLANTADDPAIKPQYIAPAGLIQAERAPEGHHAGWDTMPPRAKERVYSFFQIYFLMTGLHGIHVIIGMGLIFWVTLRSLPSRKRPPLLGLIPTAIGAYLLFIGGISGTRLPLIIGAVIIALGIGVAVVGLSVARKRPVTPTGDFSSAYFTPVDIVGLYWHLVDLIWIFLFPLLYLIH